MQKNQQMKMLLINLFLMTKFQVVIIDEDENKQVVNVDSRNKAMEIANKNRWATIYSVS